MTVSEMAKLIGQIADLAIGEFAVTVRILDVRNRFGTTDYQVTPVNGSGTAWKAADNITNVRAVDA